MFARRLLSRRVGGASLCAAHQLSARVPSPSSRRHSSSGEREGREKHGEGRLRRLLIGATLGIGLGMARMIATHACNYNKALSHLRTFHASCLYKHSHENKSNKNVLEIEHFMRTFHASVLCIYRKFPIQASRYVTTVLAYAYIESTSLLQTRVVGTREQL